MLNLLVCIDEFDHFIGGGSYLIAALAQMRKTRMEFLFLCQNPPLDEILQNIEIHAWGRQGNIDSANKGALDIGMSGLDPKMVSHYEQRSVPIGYEEVTIGYGDDVRPISRTVYGKELIERYRSHKDQIDLKQKELMNLEPGWRFVRDSKGTRLEYVQPLPRVYPKCLPGLAEARREQAISRIKAGPEYREVGGIVNDELSSGSPSTPPPPTNSGGSSSKGKAKKPPTGKSTGSDGSVESGIKELFS